MNGLKKSFLSLKSSKSPGIDNISAKVFRRCFGGLKILLKHLFGLSLPQGVFPDKLKIALVTAIYETNEKTHLRNWRYISVLPHFYNVSYTITSLSI